MRILSIETSCDETAISIVEASASGKFKVLANALFSQAKLHEEFGGVFPNLARREHQKNLVPLFLKVFKKIKPNFSDSGFRIQDSRKLKARLPAPDAAGNGGQAKSKQLKAILTREPELLEQISEHILTLPKPQIDRIAVTVGPGLEPALWVGISFAKVLSILWNVPLVPVNHMKGHFLAPLAEGKKIEFPALGLLISGGHTELLVAKSPTSYKIIGQTLDDAAGEAYDKVARILGLPYPGGPEIAKLAEQFRKDSGGKTRLPSPAASGNGGQVQDSGIKLPRPMIHSKDLNFSFSGLKTAVLYLVQKIQDSRFKIQDSVRSEIAHEFEESVKDVLITKTRKALEQNKVKTLVVGGGVSANTYIKKHLEILAKKYEVKFLASSKQLATDNAVMIGIAGFFAKPAPLSKIKAEGNLSI